MGHEEFQEARRRDKVHLRFRFKQVSPLPADC
jgi:hypothetical protein